MLDGTIFSAKTCFFFFAEEWWEQFRISRRSLSKPADEMKVNPPTCGRESSIWIRCVWTWKLLNPERKICGFKNIQIRVEGTSEKCTSYRELTCCHRCSCRPVLLISCVVVRPRRSGYCWSGCFLCSPFLFFQLKVCMQSKIQSGPCSSF